MTALLMLLRIYIQLIQNICFQAQTFTPITRTIYSIIIIRIGNSGGPFQFYILEVDIRKFHYYINYVIQIYYSTMCIKDRKVPKQNPKSWRRVVFIRKSIGVGY